MSTITADTDTHANAMLPEDSPGAAGALQGVRGRAPDAPLDPDRRPHAGHSAAEGGAARLAVVEAAAAGRAVGRPRPGRPRRRATRDRRSPTRASAAAPTPRRRSGRRSSTSAPHETAPEHRHSQNAFRFVVEGEGVWTVVNGDPVRHAPRRLPADAGLALPRPPQRHRPADGLDRRARHPLLATRTTSASSSSASERVTDEATPDFSRVASGSGATRACARCPRSQDTVAARRSAPTAGSTPTAR